MTFPYREFLGVWPGTSDYRLILRPIVPIRITGTKSTGIWDALVDTGADETLLSIRFAELLGVELDANTTSLAAGITGGPLTVRYGSVVFGLESDGQAFQWPTTVGFVDYGPSADPLIILGHAGCLDYFRAIFDGELAQLELSPNAYLPTSIATPPD